MQQVLTQKKCPRCGSALKELAEEKQFKPIGHGRKDKMSPIHRQYFQCGAVVLIDRLNPNGSLEALCCVRVN